MDKGETIDQNGIIYIRIGNECNKEYIGETGKELRERITEHKNAVRRCDALSAIYQHIRTTNNSID